MTRMSRSISEMDITRRDINYKVLRYVRAGQTVLSIGCSSGKLESEMKRAGLTVYGIDIDQAAVLQARRELDRCEVFDVESSGTFPYAGTQFDAIMFIDVLEHLRNPRHALHAAASRLKPTGVIIVSLPNVANWSVRLTLLFGRFDYSSCGILDRTHLCLYTLRSARQLLDASGYERIGEDYTTNLLNTAYGAVCPSAPRTTEAAQYPLREKNKSFGGVRAILRRIAETMDAALGRCCKGLFAYQFIFVARPIRQAAKE